MTENNSTEVSLLLNLYQSMLRIRMVEEKLAELYPEQEMRCPVHLCIGQEAVSAGVSAHLSDRDYAFSSHRSHGHYLGKGGSLKLMMAEIYGKATGCSLGKGGSMHLVDLDRGFFGATPIVGSTIPIGVGAAFASVMKGEERVVVVYLGEGATEEGVFHESMNFASLKKLPVIFVCENNFFSVYSPMSVRQPAHREVFMQAIGHGVEGHQADGNDVITVHEVAGRAVDKARRGGGPTFLEFKTYRWREHCGPFFDNDIGYRTEEEYREWLVRCPINQAREYLLTKDPGMASRLEAMVAAIAKEIEEAVQFAKSSPFPTVESLHEHLYA